MAILGKESDLAALLTSSIDAKIRSEIQAACGASPLPPNCIDGLAAGISKGIADVLISFLVSNVEVSTNVLVGPHPIGGAAIGTGDGNIT